MDGAPLLTTSSLTVSFGGLVAVSAVDLDVRPGELVGLIGPNGAGKTTALDAICGFAPHRGRVNFAGSDLSDSPSHVRARAGIARTWQSVELFDDLTIRENCEVAAEPAGLATLLGDLVAPLRGRRASSRTRATHVAAVDAALERVGLADDADCLPSELSSGHQKLAGVARALAASPRLLLLDEPAAGLDSVESVELGRRLRELMDLREGSGEPMAGLLIDHDTRLVFDICDRIYVLDFGSVIASGTPDEVRSDPAVIEAYLGLSGEAIVVPGKQP